MNQQTEIKIKLYIIFSLVVIILALINFNFALYFHFWLDDWMNLWFVLNGYVKGYQGQFDIHPGNYVMFLGQAFLFGTNPLPYNWFGLIFKIIAAFLVGSLGGLITKSKKGFLVGTLLYASYFGAEESFVFTTARNNVLNLILVCLTIIFFLQSKYTQKKRFFILCLFFLCLSFLSDPGRMVFLPFLLIIYEVVNWINRRDISGKKLGISILVISLASLIAFFSTPLGRNPAGQAESEHFQKTFLVLSNYQAFFTGIGDLVAAYLHPLTPLPPSFSWILGVLFILFLVFWSLRQILKQRNLEAAVFLNGVWLFLFLNWLAFPYLIAVSQHRYQTISSAFFVVLLTFWIIKFKKWTFQILIILISLNLVHAFVINKDWDTIRNYSKVQGLIDKELALIPENSSPQLLILEGSTRIVSEELSWTFGGIVPYSFSKHIKSMRDLPSTAPTFEQNVQIFCNDLGVRPVIADSVQQDQKMNISQVYGFKVNDFEQLENNTDQVRMKILGQAGCVQKTSGKEVFPELKLVNYISSEQMYELNKTGIYLNWQINKSQIDQLTIDYESEDLSSKIEETHFPVEVSKIEGESFGQIIFVDGKTDFSSLTILVKSCFKNNCQMKQILISL